MNHIHAIKNGVQYIEQNIDKNIRIDDVAKSAYYSTYYFSRIFLKNIGITLGSYINLRKRGFASSQLLYTSTNLIDISLNAGYSSYEAFCREIKSKYGMSPYYYRNIKISYYLMSCSLLDDELINHLNNKLIIIPKKVTLASFEVIGYPVMTSLKDNKLPLLWSEFNILKKKLFGSSASVIKSFSICESPKATLSEDANCFFSQFLASEKTEYGIDFPKEFIIQTILGGKYILFEHKSGYHSLGLSYRYIWNIWFHSIQIEFDNTRKSFECYGDNKNLIQIYIPIK